MLWKKWKNFWNSVKIWPHYRHKRVARFLGHSVVAYLGLGLQCLTKLAASSRMYVKSLRIYLDPHEFCILRDAERTLSCIRRRLTNTRASGRIVRTPRRGAERWRLRCASIDSGVEWPRSRMPSSGRKRRALSRVTRTARTLAPSSRHRPTRTVEASPVKSYSTRNRSASASSSINPMTPITS